MNGRKKPETRRPVTILVAEDDPDDRLLLEKAFEGRPDAGTLEFAADGVELMDRLHRRGRFADVARYPEPGLLLLDLNMPRKDGREALAEIKRDPALRALPVVVLTTSNAEEDVHRSYHLGANSYIRKPTSFTGLVSAIDSFSTYWLRVVELPPEPRKERP